MKNPELMNRNTRQQQVIFDTIRSAGRPLSPAEILEEGQKECRSLGIATVYRGVKRLLHEGLIAQVTIPGKVAYYEDAEVAAKHHHHFHCDRCGHVYDVKGCSERIPEMTPSGYMVRRHDLILYGECSDCGENPE
jgi:Fur family transcriptional regulator, ferric uptake regulator